MASPTTVHRHNHFSSRKRSDLNRYQASPEASLELLDRCLFTPGTALSDIGAGDSWLVEALPETGFSHIHVGDISAAGLSSTKTWLGILAQQVNGIESDIPEFEPVETYDAGHDHTAFHFRITTEEVECTCCRLQRT